MVWNYECTKQNRRQMHGINVQIGRSQDLNSNVYHCHVTPSRHYHVSREFEEQSLIEFKKTNYLMPEGIDVLQLASWTKFDTVWYEVRNSFK